MADVVSIGANFEAIKTTERVLEDLKSGKIVAVGFVLIHDDLAVGTGWSQGPHYHHLNSGAARLAARLATVEDDY